MRPLINNIAGAMSIQRLFDRIEWRGQGGFAVFARKLRKSPPGGITARPTVILVGRGDQSAPLADAASLVRDGDLEDRTVCIGTTCFSQRIRRPSRIRTRFTDSKGSMRPPIR
jgi:hypothetical protein